MSNYVVKFLVVLILTVNVVNAADCESFSQAELDRMLNIFSQCDQETCENGEWSGSMGSRRGEHPWTVELFCIRTRCSNGDKQETTPFLVGIPCTPFGKNDTPPEPTVNRCEKGSVIYPSTQTIGESIPIVGAPFSLMYFSNRVKGRLEDYKFKYRFSAPTTFGGNQIKIELFDDSSNLVDSQLYSAGPSSAPFQYVYALPIPSSLGSAKYELVNTRTNVNGHSFEIRETYYIGSFRAETLGIGGWFPSNWHFYDSVSKSHYKPDGTKRAVEAQLLVSGEYRLAAEDGSEVYEFDSHGRHLRTKTAVQGSTLISFEYTLAGKLNKVVERNGRETIFDRNMSGDLISITSASGKVTSVTLTAQKYLASATDPLVKTYSLTYAGTEGLLGTFEKPTGEISTFTYDIDGNLTKDEHSGGSWTELIPQSRDGAELPYAIMSLSRSGIQKLYTNRSEGDRSGAGEGVSIVGNPSHIEDNQNKYSVSGTNIVSTQNGVTVTQTHTADPRFGSQVRYVDSITEDSTGSSQQRNFSDSVTLSTPTDPWSITAWTKIEQFFDGVANRTTTSTYTPGTKTWVRSSPMGRTNTKIYDSSERLISDKKGNLNAVTYTFEMDQIKTVSHTAPRTTTYNYDSTTRLLTSIVNPLSEITSFTYDNNERMTSQTLPDSNVITYAHDDSGRLVGITPPSRPLHSFTINASEHVGNYLAPSEVTGTNFYYNYDQQMTQILKPSGAYINYDYDVTNGDLVGITTGTGSRVLTRDTNTRRVTNITAPSGFTLDYTYGGNAITSEYLSDPFTSPVGQVGTQYAVGRVSQKEINIGGTVHSLARTYNNDELPTGVGSMTLGYTAMPNGILNKLTLSSVVENITTDNFAEITYRDVKRSTTTLFTESLTRDNLGRIAQRVIAVSGWASKTFNYIYDSRGRLAEVQDGSLAWIRKYTYNDNGNRATMQVASPASTTTYTTNNQDQLTAAGVFTYTYDADGFVASRTNTLLSQTASYVYDAQGNLTQVTLENGDVIDYEIDGLNRRVGKYKNTVLQERYLWDGSQLVAEIKPDGTYKRIYVYVTKPHAPDYYIEAGQNYKIVTDTLGSPIMVVRVSNGNIIQRIEYDEFGRVLADNLSGELAIGFGGGLSDWDTKLVRFGARDYDPSTGRWLSKDPILFNGGDANLYGYVASDPVNSIDPTGLYEVCTTPLSGFGSEFGPVYHQYLCANGVCGGQTRTGNPFNSPGTNSNDGAPGSTGATCEKKDEGSCMDKCIAGAIGGSRPNYSVINVGGSNCQKWANDAIARCAAQCGGK